MLFNTFNKSSRDIQRNKFFKYNVTNTVTVTAAISI